MGNVWWRRRRSLSHRWSKAAAAPLDERFSTTFPPTGWADREEPKGRKTRDKWCSIASSPRLISGDGNNFSLKTRINYNGREGCHARFSARHMAVKTTAISPEISQIWKPCSSSFPFPNSLKRFLTEFLIFSLFFFPPFILFSDRLPARSSTHAAGS